MDKSTSATSELPKSMDFGKILIHHDMKDLSDSTGNQKITLPLSPSSMPSVFPAESVAEFLDRVADLRYDAAQGGQGIYYSPEEYETRPAQGMLSVLFQETDGQMLWRKGSARRSHKITERDRRANHKTLMDTASTVAGLREPSDSEAEVKERCRQYDSSISSTSRRGSTNKNDEMSEPKLLEAAIRCLLEKIYRSKDVADTKYFDYMDRYTRRNRFQYTEEMLDSLHPVHALRVRNSGYVEIIETFDGQKQARRRSRKQRLRRRQSF